MSRRLWGVALGMIAAGSAHAAEIASEVRLATAADAAQVCDLLVAGESSARERLYVMELPASAFALAPWDEARREIAVDGARGFTTRDGVELMLDALIPPDPPRAPHLPMRIPATREEGAAILAAHRAGALRLELWFRAAPGQACARVHRVRGDGTRLAIAPLAFALWSGKRLVVRGETPEFAALREAEGPVLEPAVTIGPLLYARGGLASERMNRAAATLADGLVACYRAGLATDPTLRGSLVAGLSIDRDGRVTEARTELDGLGVAAATECALGQMRSARFPRGKATSISVPLKFAGR